MASAPPRVGLIPWVPLARFDGPPEPIFRECKTRITRDAPKGEREALLVVTHFLAGLKYNEPQLFETVASLPGSPESRPTLARRASEGREP
jgi:hypothetical protein